MYVATQRLSTFRASWVGNMVVQTRLSAHRCTQQRERYGGAIASAKVIVDRIVVRRRASP
jgi:hypothetical protein